jgi:hypothetical protein
MPGSFASSVMGKRLPGSMPRPVPATASSSARCGCFPSDLLPAPLHRQRRRRKFLAFSRCLLSHSLQDCDECEGTGTKGSWRSCGDPINTGEATAAAAAAAAAFEAWECGREKGKGGQVRGRRLVWNPQQYRAAQAISRLIFIPEASQEGGHERVMKIHPTNPLGSPVRPILHTNPALSPRRRNRPL